MRRLIASLFVLFALTIIVRAAGPTYLPFIGCTGYVQGNGIGVPITCSQTLPAVPNASGSSQQTNGTISAGTNALNVFSAIDFANGQGVNIYGAGPAISATAPVIASVTQQGATGSTTYQIYLSSFDLNGGYSAPSTATITNGNATLTFTNKLTVTAAVPSGAAGWIMWVSINGGPATYATASNTSVLDWTGYYQTWRPNWVPAVAPSVAQNDWLVATINTGAGTTGLTLSATASTSVSGAFVQHDDTAALQAINTPGGPFNLNCGVYNVTSQIIYTKSYLHLIGSGMCTQVQQFGASNGFVVQGTSPTAFIDGVWIENMYMPAYNSLGGEAVFTKYFTRTYLVNMVIDHPFSGVENYDGNDFHWEHLRIYDRWGYGAVDWRIDSGSGPADYVCCGYLIDVYSNDLADVQNPNNVGPQGMRDAGACWYITGNVATIFMYGDANSSCEGKAWYVGNDVGNAAPPQFIQAQFSGAEFANDRAISLEAGQLIYFTESNIHGSGKLNVNNVSIASNVAFVQFSGGFNDTGGANCFDISGPNVTIMNMKIYNCSGFLTQAYHSIVLEPSSSSVSIVGNNFQGQWGGVSWQTAHPIYINSGATTFACGGNTFASFQYNYEQNNAGYSLSQNCDGNAGRPPASISSGFGTAPSIVAGSAYAFSLNVGTGGTAYAGVVNMPIATNGWVCSATDANSSAAFTKVFQTGTSQITIQNYNGSGTSTAWGSGDTIRVSCSY